MDIKIDQLVLFCERWLDKANSYTTGDLAGCFDRFTSFYVVFNRVYTEAGKVLIAEGKVNPPKKPYYLLPDKKSATSHILTYYGNSDNGKSYLDNELASDPHCKQALESIATLIIDEHFYLHIGSEGTPNYEKDIQLAKRTQEYQTSSVLELIYQARCNLFHGTKGYDPNQRELLDSMSVVIEFVTKKVLEKLKRDLIAP